MEAVLIRHGDPDIEACKARGFAGHSINFCPLSPKGREQAEETAADPALAGAQIILSSPYTRALETAAILSRRLQLPLVVEMALHESLSDKTFGGLSGDALSLLHQDFILCKGTPPPGETKKWETIDEISRRIKEVFDRYLAYRKIIAVTHGGIVKRFTGSLDAKYCTPYSIVYDQDFTFHSWID